MSATPDPSTPASSADLTRLLGSARDALNALSRLQQAALEECGNKPDRELEWPSFHWHAALTPDELAEQVLDAVRTATAVDRPVLSGHVYCYHCENATCEHAVPSSPGQVFAGYGNTGRPQWSELFSFLLSIDDERMDELFADPPSILARVVSRRRLIDQQFSAFGRGSLTYRIIGQVVAGYLNIADQRCALSVQIVETRDHRLHLQVITPDFVREALADASPKQAEAFHRIFDALRDARHRVAKVSQSWRTCARKKGRRELREKLFSILRHVAHSIERKGRQNRRRTSHAETRSLEQRPVHMASEDVRRAQSHNFYHDQMTQHIIVTGRNGRLHVFTREGRQVTSLVLPGDKLENRARRRRYVPMPPEDAWKFSNMLLEKEQKKQS